MYLLGEPFGVDPQLEHGVGLDETVLIDGLCIQRNGSRIRQYRAVILDGSRWKRDLRAEASSIRALRYQDTLTGIKPDVSTGSLDPAVVFNVTVAPAATVPTLSQWGLFLLAGLLAGAAAIKLHRRSERGAS